MKAQRKVAVQIVGIKARGKWVQAGYAILDYAVLFSTIAMTSYAAYQLLHRTLARILGAVIADL